MEKELDQPCSPISEGTERTTSGPSSPERHEQQQHAFTPVQQQQPQPVRQEPKKTLSSTVKRFSSSFLPGAAATEEEEVLTRRGSHGSQLLQLQLRHGGSQLGLSGGPGGGLPPTEPVCNPRRGSATGSFGLPVPPEWIRAQADHQQQHQHQQRRGSSKAISATGERTMMALALDRPTTFSLRLNQVGAVAVPRFCPACGPTCWGRRRPPWRGSLRSRLR